MADVRIFIAINLAAEVGVQVEALLQSLRRIQPQGIRWSMASQLHFTLAFLGSLPDESLPRVEGICRRTAAAGEPFVMQPGTLGVFPPRGAARVLWLGLIKGAEEMMRLQARLTAGLTESGFTVEERAFVPHLTLGRVRPGARMNAPLLQAESKPVLAAQTVTELAVMRSDLSPSGARHTVLAFCPLTQK